MNSKKLLWSKKFSKRGVRQKRREPMPMPGMMIHQDGSTHFIRIEEVTTGIHPEAGGKVDKSRHPIWAGFAVVGISMIATYSPEARGRSERAFQTHQDRLRNLFYME